MIKIPEKFVLHKHYYVQFAGNVLVCRTVCTGNVLKIACLLVFTFFRMQSEIRILIYVENRVSKQYTVCVLK